MERLELSWRAFPVLPVARGAPHHTHLVAAVHTGVQEGHTAPGVGCLCVGAFIFFVYMIIRSALCKGSKYLQSFGRTFLDFL